MKPKFLVTLEHFWNFLLGLLRRRRSNTLDVVRRVFSASLGLIGPIRSPPKQLKELSRTGADGGKRVGWRSRADSICYNTLPTHLSGGADGSTVSRSNTDLEIYRSDTLVGLQEGGPGASVDVGKSRTGSDVEMKQLTLHDPNPLETIGGGEGSKSPDRLGLSFEVDGLWPVGVYESERYKRGIKLVKGLPKGYIIPPLTIGCSKPKLPSGWAKYVHPEGAIYFWNTNKRVVTDADILDSKILSKVEDCVSNIEGYIKRYSISHVWGGGVHLYLEPLRYESGFGYYFVDHSNRTLFWLEGKYAFELVAEVQTPTLDPEHLDIILESQYWHHNEYFPHIEDVPEDALIDLQNALWHAFGDRLTAESSLVPYTLEQIKDIQQLISVFVATYREYRQLEVGARTIVYRMLSALYRDRFLNFYGQRAARLFLTHSLFEESKRTWFIKFTSPFLFYAPEVHLAKLQSMSTDNIVSQSSWSKLLNMLEEEWKESILYATVLLTSNVSFLDIGSLDELGSKGYRDPAQRASYFSVAVSIGAIALGLLLVRQHPRQYPKTLDRNFLIERSRSAIRLEILAVMYSLPYALLMYGTLTFFLAFSIMCSETRDAPTIVISTFAWTATVIFLLWCISASFKSTFYESLVKECNRLKAKLHQRWGRTKVAEGTGSKEENV